MELKFIKSSSKSTENFVGIKVLKEVVEIHYPEFFVMDTSNTKNAIDEIILLMETIYENSEYEDNLTSTEFGYQNSVGKNLFYAYYWLIQHSFKDIDIRSKYKKIKKNQNGKLNWRKIFISDFILVDESIYFPNIYSDNYDLFDDDFIEIYNYCLFEAIANLGWLFKIKREISYNRKIHIKKSIKVLSDLIRVTNNEDKRLLISYLITILYKKSDNELNNILLFGTQNFELIFESMLFKTLNNVEKISDFYPKSTWVINGASFDNSKLRPDAIYEYNDGFILIDAKYYRYCITGKASDLPRTDSVQKQLTYQEYIEIKTSKRVFYNVFILPTNAIKVNNNFNYIGYVLAEWKNINAKIYAFSISLNFLCEISRSKNKTNKDQLILDMIKDLQENL